MDLLEISYLSIFRKSVEKIQVLLKSDKKTIFHMKTYYLAEFFLQWELFQTNVVEEIKTHSLCLVTSFRKSYCLPDVKKYGRASKVHALCVLDN
jgi:hypothetical protein